MDLELAGRVALVTGATRGIGRAIATKLAAEGCAVAICARDADAVAQTVAALEAQGVKAFGASVDITDDAALEAFVDAAAQTLGGLDLVVANAGGSAGENLLTETTGDDWRRTMELNVVHAAVLVRAAVPHLRARGGGAALVIASISGSRPQPKAPVRRREGRGDPPRRLARPRARPGPHPRQRPEPGLDPLRGRLVGPPPHRRSGRVRRVRQDRVPPRAPRHRRGDRRRRRVPPVAPRELGQRHRAHRRRRSEPARDGRASSPLARVPDPVVMGMVNVTPDSFSDGGRWLDPEKAIAHARRLVGRRRGHPRHRRRVDAAGREPGGRRRAAAAHRARVRGRCRASRRVCRSTRRRRRCRPRGDRGRRGHRQRRHRPARRPRSRGPVRRAGRERLPHAHARRAAHDAGRPALRRRRRRRQGVPRRAPGARGRRGHRRGQDLARPGDRLRQDRRPQPRAARAPGRARRHRPADRRRDVAQGVPRQDQRRGDRGRVPGTIATNVIALGNGAEVFRVHDVAAVAQALDVAAATFRGQWNGATTTSTTSTTT